MLILHYNYFNVWYRYVAIARCRYHTATNPYFAISKAKTALEMVVFIKLSKGHSCHIITSAIIKNKCIKVR